VGSYTGHSGLRAPRRLRSVPLAEHGAARTPDLVPDPPSLQDRLLAEDERRQGVRRRRYGRVIDPRTFAQIIFKVSRRGGKLWISSDSLGLVAGHRIREASSRSWTLTFDSYIPYAGVKPGLNELEFGLEQTKGVRIKSLRFFVDSGIRYSPYSPARITLRARALPRRVRLGHPVRVVATMRNTGDRGIGNALLLVDYRRDEFRVRGPDSRRLRLPGKSRVRASFSLEPLRSGEFELDVEARAALPSRLRSPVVVGPARGGDTVTGAHFRPRLQVTLSTRSAAGGKFASLEPPGFPSAGRSRSGSPLAPCAQRAGRQSAALRPASPRRRSATASPHRPLRAGGRP
jgi:hypothetical protein